MKKAFKKIMAMGLATLLGIGTMNMMMVSADNTALNTELLVNGDFSLKDEDGAVVGWSLTKPSGSGGSIKVENEVLRINALHGNVADGNLDTSKSLYAINRWDYAKPANGTTVISGRIHIESMQEGSSVVIDSNREGFGPANSMGATITYTKPTSGWETFETTITKTTTSDAGYLFFVRVYGTALVWVDDVSIQHKERLLVPGNLNWSGSSALVNANYGYISDEAYTGTAVTPYSGDDCFYIWNGTYNGTSYSSARATTLLAANPVAGQTYRISMRFKPNVAEATYLGPRTDILDFADRGNSNKLLRIDKDDWTVGNVTSDGWSEISAYFTMPTYTVTNLGLKFWGYFGGWIDDLMIERDCDKNMEILSSDFETIEKAAPGATIKLKAHIVSDKTAEQGGRKVKVVLVRYAKVGNAMQCVEVNVGDETVNMGTAIAGYTTSAKDIRLDYVIPSDAEGQIIKAFLWDGENTLTPIGKRSAITVSAN